MIHRGPLAVAVVATLSLITLVLQAAVLRPHLYPAGAGLMLSGDATLDELGEHPAVGFAHLPDLGTALGQPVTLTGVWPGSTAERAGLRPGMRVTSIADASGTRVDIGDALPADPGAALQMWAQMYEMPPTGSVTLTVVEAPDMTPHEVTLERPAVWSLDAETQFAWFWQFHGPTLAKHFVYTLAALLIVALGARGQAATFITLAFLMMGATDAGPLRGVELTWPVASGVLLSFNWMLASVTFPTIGLALLYFPSRAPFLDRHRWVLWWLWIAAVPLAAIVGLSAAYLLGASAAEPAVSWLALRPWAFNTCFAIGLGTNFALLAAAVVRYRRTTDQSERRRSQAVLTTAVPGMTAYALASAVPLLAGTLGMEFVWPWPIAAFLHGLVLLSAFGLAYAVAVRRAMNPRTVLRQGLQYALARRTLAVLTVLPAVLLVVALIRQRDQSLAMIVEAQPLFYLTSLALLALGLRYRDRAQRWIDRRFFRAEYDAREILLQLAGRVPHETDPRALVSLVLTDIESALHPASLAVLAEQGDRYEVVEARHATPPPLPSSGGLAQLLRWSEAPLEVFLDDPRSAVRRLPGSDREWLRAAGAALLVPVSAESGPDRPLVGVMVIGPKRSEEAFTSEDRRLLAGIASQMGLALDLSRLRRLAAATPRAPLTSPPPVALTGAASSAVEVGTTIDGKYRVDALIGRGGMGAVYRARDVRLDRDVAIKVVRGELVSSPEARERFRREARLAARLQHPAIVTIFDFGTLPDGSAYLVMEYVRGEDLRARLSRGPLDWRDAVHLASAVAEGVEAAHRAQVLHRDLKPENVLLPEDGGGPKVLDFGVARMMAAGDTPGTATAAGTIVGTPAYMAPEQIRGGAIDARADVFSLAVLTYEMVTGGLPFGAGSFVDIALRQAVDDPPLDAAPVPDRLAGVLRRALSMEPDRRPKSAAALAAELRDTLGP